MISSAYGLYEANLPDRSFSLCHVFEGQESDSYPTQPKPGILWGIPAHVLLQILVAREAKVYRSLFLLRSSVRVLRWCAYVTAFLLYWSGLDKVK